MRRRALRVAVSPAVRRHSPRSGHGRLWARGLAELGRLARVREVAPGAHARADVWLADGYDPPPEPGPPVVAYMSEAPWGQPAALVGLDPVFVAALAAAGRAGAERADRLTMPSQCSRAQAAQLYGFDPERIDVVALGTDVDRFAAGRAADGRARVGAPYVLFVGQVHPRKNLGALRAAMALLAEGHVPRTLALVVSGAADRPDSAELLAAAKAPIRGVPIVAVERPTEAELADLMAGADAYCLPSLSEGFGLTAAEAMAAGAPVVAADRGALPEVVGDAGLLAAPTPDALAAALERVLTDAALADWLRAAGRERASGLTWGQTARGWLASLQRAA